MKVFRTTMIIDHAADGIGDAEDGATNFKNAVKKYLRSQDYVIWEKEGMLVNTEYLGEYDNVKGIIVSEREEKK